MATLAQLLDAHPRVRVLRAGLPDPTGNCVLYWMQRAQRGKDNPALNLAIALGNTLKLPVLCGFGLTHAYPSAQARHYQFLLEGLVDAQADLLARNVPFVLRLGSPDDVILQLAREVRPAIVVGDENPIRVARLWREKVASSLKIPFHLVDADVVVPSSLFPKEEYAARTIRPKIHKVLAEYLNPVPNLKAKVSWKPSLVPQGEGIDPAVLMLNLKPTGVGPVAGYKGGTREAERRLERFLRERLLLYAEQRNEPTPYVTSELSAHLHFGQISPITVALAVQASGVAPTENIDVYIEEMIVRRELAINFVTRNPNYDSLEGCPEWARLTLEKHRSDPRKHLYTTEQLEAGLTHDPLWNAAQLEMVITGRMHNYLRMYWAKKILEWTPDAETAFRITLELNDRHEMDGRDPNGYTGVAWAIGGKHDRPWPERPIFGTVRFMSYESTRKKFDSEGYIARVRSLVNGRGQRSLFHD